MSFPGKCVYDGTNNLHRSDLHRSSSWWDRRRGCSGAKSAYLSSLHLCHKNDKSYVLDLCCAAYEEQDKRNNWKRYPVNVWEELFWHRLAHICTSGSWLENAGSDVAPKQEFDPRIVGNVALGPRMPAAESQVGAEVRGWANVLVRDSFRGKFLENHRMGSSIT